jgi:hypothetical protein
MFDVMGRTLCGQFMALSLVCVCALIVAAGLATCDGVDSHDANTEPTVPGWGPTRMPR